MILVKVSASIAFEDTHLKRQFSFSLSLMSNSSRVVRNSSHVGVAVLVATSKTLLQSVATPAKGALPKTSEGSAKSTLGSLSHSHNSLNQEILSSVELRATDSALKVDLTTRGTFLEDHATGQITETLLSSSALFVVKMMVPCLEVFSLEVAKEASENPQKVTALTGIATKERHSGLPFVSI